MKKLISYIFPIYNESGNIDLLYKTINTLLKTKPSYEYEIICVNDGSKDDSIDQLIELHQKDKRVKVIDLSRNFGHQLAVTAGLDHARGDAVIIMDSDMQDPPRVSFELLKKWEEGFEVVYAQRRSRQDTFFKKLTARWFYIILEKLADIKIPRDTGDFRLMDRKVVDALKRYPEHNRFLRGLISSMGFRQTAVLFDRDKRHAGTTNYPLKKMLKLASDGIIGFSSFPLKLIGRVGFFFAFLSFVGILYAIWMKLFHPEATVPGWTMIMVGLLFIGSINMIMLGVVGSYVGRIYTEVQGRPLYLVSRVFGMNDRGGRS